MKVTHVRDIRMIQPGFHLFHSSALKYTKKTHYETLGVDRKATKREIRLAFLNLSKQHHPDLNKNKDAHKHFMEINEAYNILHNPAKRHHYDINLHSGEQHVGMQPPFKSYSSTYEHAGNYHNISEEEWAKMYRASIPKRNHLPLILALIVFMISGSLLHSVRIQAAHKEYQKRADEESRKNREVYESVRERAANSTVAEQLERLSRLHNENRNQ